MAVALRVSFCVVTFNLWVLFYIWLHESNFGLIKRKVLIKYFIIFAGICILQFHCTKKIKTFIAFRYDLII